VISGIRSRLTAILQSRTFGSALVFLTLAAAWARYPSPLTGLIALILLASALPSRESRQVGFLIAGSVALVGLIAFLILYPDRIAWTDENLNTYFWVILLSFWMVLISSLGERWSGRLTLLLALIVVAEMTLTLSHNLILPVTRGRVGDPLVGTTLLSMAAAALISLYAGAYVFLRLRGVLSGALLGGMSLAIVGIVRLSVSPPDVWRIAREPLVFLDFPFSVSLIVGAGMFPALLVHLLSLIPDPREWLERRKAIYYLIYLPCLWVTVDLLTEFYSGGSPGYILLGIYIICAYTLAGLAITVRGYITARQRRIRREMLFILISLLISFILVGLGGIWGGSLSGQVWGFGLFYAAWGIIPTTLGYAVVKRRAPNAGAIIRWVLINSILFLIMALLWIGLYYGVLRFLFPARGKREAIAFLIVLVVGAIMPMMRARVREFVDKTFYKESYDYSRTLTQFTRALTSIIDYDKLVDLLVSRICETMRISRGALLLNSPQEPGTLKVASVRGVGGMRELTFDSDGPLARELMGKGEPVSIEELERIYKSGGISRDEMEKIIRFDAEFCVPIFSKQRLIGMILLGPKISGAAYSHEDSVLLSALADQAAITVENIRLYAERAEQDRIRRELENARRIQIGILPDEDPQSEVIEISSFFKPAAEVGGDYYDYVRFSGSKVGIAIGDVSGHGLDAGLLVSMAKSCLFTTTRQSQEISEVMKAMNEMVCQVKVRLFMTFAFSTIDAERHLLSISSAGHPFPYHLSAATGELTTVEEGMYPLGVRRDISYPIYEFRLGPGDLLIYFSDGIIETVNEKGEQLGFERFEEIIKRCAGGHARSVRDRILSEFDAFRGNAPMVDDVTLIVVRYI
jgi:serine phosphatase RsbU (regulator of sigma subunit)